MTGFLSDLGLDKIDDDPNEVPAGKYTGFLFDARVVELKDAAKGKRLVLTYKVADEGAHKGKTVDEWKSVNPFDDARTKGFLKQRMKSLGVPEERLGSITPDDLIGTPVNFTVKKNGEYTNVTFVEVRDGNSSESTTASAPAGAATDLL